MTTKRVSRKTVADSVDMRNVYTEYLGYGSWSEDAVVAEWPAVLGQPVTPESNLGYRQIHIVTLFNSPKGANASTQECVPAYIVQYACEVEYGSYSAKCVQMNVMSVDPTFGDNPADLTSMEKEVDHWKNGHYFNSRHVLTRWLGIQNESFREYALHLFPDAITLGAPVSRDVIAGNPGQKTS